MRFRLTHRPARRSRVSLPVLLTAPLLLTLVAPLSPAGADGQSPNDVPAASTPSVNDGAVQSIAQVGNTIVLGGSFSEVSDAGSTTPIPRDRVASFNAGSGVVTRGFAPTFDGPVSTVRSAGDGQSIFVAGNFNQVNGQPAKGLVKLDLATGQRVPTFAPPAISGPVNALALNHGVLYAGGSFKKVGTLDRRGLAAFNPTSGRVSDAVAVPFTGDRAVITGGNPARVGLRDFAVSPDGKRLVAIGNFTQAGPRAGNQVAMLSLGARANVVKSWATRRYAPSCAPKFASYMRGVDFAPNGRSFVIVTTGGRFRDPSDLCDSAARWETRARGRDLQPTWTARTGADTLLSVAVTRDTVFVGGHQRWLNNPTGRDNAGPGAVPRPGIAALQTDNGLPYAWNPGRHPRGYGTSALLATSSGLWIGSDTDYIGNRRYLRKKVAFFPYAGGAALPQRRTGQLPGDVYEFAPLADADTSRVDKIHFTGTTTTSRVRAGVSGARKWRGMQGAMMVDNELFYATDDGHFYRRTFNGTTLGTARTIEPYHDPAWKDVSTGSGEKYDGAHPGFYQEIPSITGMFYAGGRIYYTRDDSLRMRSRAFSVDSGIVSQSVHAVRSGINWSTTRGIFQAGGYVYFAKRRTGALAKVAFRNGRLVGDPVNVPGASGQSTRWAARGLVLYSG